MTVDELTTAVVSAVAQYLQRRSTAGIAAVNMDLEVLVNQLQTEATPDTLAAEMFHRLTGDPTNQQAAQMLQMQLSEMVRKDPEVGKRLETAIRGGTQMPTPNPKRRMAVIGSIAVVAVVALVLAFVIGRSSGGTAEAVGPTVTQTVTPEPTTTVPTETTSTEDTTTTEETTTDESLTDGETPSTGDGSAVEPGSSVMVSDLPKPDDSWEYQEGDHDVQLTQYPNSFWHELNTCDQSYYHADQQFTLKNFARLEVTAIGLDSTSDPGLEVKFEVFAGNNMTKPIATKVVKPGKTEKISVALPKDTFALTFRASVTSLTKSDCLNGHAVWGRPYVVAPG